MAKEKKILVIGEGAKVEEQMVSRLFESYPDNAVETWKIVSFGANLYHLYDELEKEYDGDWENLDILNLLAQGADEDELEILRDSYTDIVLIFDFDSHDGHYSRKSVERMLEVFSDSTSPLGRLYLNYPMIEAVLDFDAFDTDNYLEKTMTLPKYFSGGQYKDYIHRTGCIRHFKSLNHENIALITYWVLRKISAILQRDAFPVAGLVECLKEIACWQNDSFEQSRTISILGTSVLFLYEYNPQMVMEGHPYFGERYAKTLAVPAKI